MYNILMGCLISKSDISLKIEDIEIDIIEKNNINQSIEMFELPYNGTDEII